MKHEKLHFKEWKKKHYDLFLMGEYDWVYGFMVIASVFWAAVEFTYG